MSKIAAIIGRILLALIFIVSGFNKLLDPSGTAAMMSSAGLPGGFAIPVAIFELVAGLCLAIGFAVRLVSLLLIAFVVLTILFFHREITDPSQAVMALKNLSIIGGLLLAFAHSHMWSHYYTITRERKGERATHETEQKLHEAELRAARAEGLAEGRGEAHPAAAHVDRDGDGIPDAHETRRSRRRKWLDW